MCVCFFLKAKKKSCVLRKNGTTPKKIMRFFIAYATLWSILSLIEAIIFETLLSQFHGSIPIEEIDSRCNELLQTIGYGSIILFLSAIGWGCIAIVFLYKDFNKLAFIFTLQLVVMGIYIICEIDQSIECNNENMVQIFHIQFYSLLLLLIATIFSVCFITFSLSHEEQEIYTRNDV